MVHPITDFKLLYPLAFNSLIEDYIKDLEIYKNGAWICECNTINSIDKSMDSYIRKNKRGYGVVGRKLQCLVCGNKAVLQVKAFSKKQIS